MQPTRLRDVSESRAVADQLVSLHFTRQDEVAADFDDLEIVALDPFLRGLLFTDGTVSRALEAHTLSGVAVEPVDQATVPADEPISRYLEVPDATECIRRRVTMHIADTRPVAVWAESHLVIERLPSDFVNVLGATPQGIGGSLQRMHLESYRELLQCGLRPPPPWAAEQERQTTAMTRTYRVITQGLPALLIQETFAVEERAGAYSLIGSSARAAAASTRDFS
jgi:chorismate-pyruvate lyase